MKKLLVGVKRGLVVNAGVQTFVIIVVKISGDAGLGVDQIGKNGPFAAFEFFGFEPGPEAPKTFSRFSAWALS